jgi:hypothetical protein
MKEETVIKVISSSGEPYDVQFKFFDNKFSVVCHCPAGIYGKLCKHKIGLLDGDTSLLFDKTDSEILTQIYEAVKRSKYIEIISSYNNLKKEIEAAQNKEKKLKEKIEHALKTGIETF